MPSLYVCRVCSGFKSSYLSFLYQWSYYLSNYIRFLPLPSPFHPSKEFKKETPHSSESFMAATVKLFTPALLSSSKPFSLSHTPQLLLPISLSLSSFHSQNSSFVSLSLSHSHTSSLPFNPNNNSSQIHTFSVDFSHTGTHRFAWNSLKLYFSRISEKYFLSSTYSFLNF